MTDEQIKGIARAINPHWWNDDIDLLDFTRAVLARAGQKHPSSGESHEDSLKSRDEALRLADELDWRHQEVADCPEREAAAELRGLHQSEREGWRYAAELEQQRKECMGTRYENDFRSMQDMFNGTCDGVLPEQPKAIKLASWLEADARSIQIKKEAAEELRRLHDELVKVKQITLNDEALLQQALEALEKVGVMLTSGYNVLPEGEAHEDVLAAIRALKEKT